MKKLFLAALFCGAMGGLMTSCDNNDTPSTPSSKLEIPTTYRAFVLNAGKFKGNNSNLTYFDPSGIYAPIANVFFQQNGKKIGDTGESMIYENGSIYLAVYGSNVLYKMNKDGVVEKSRSLYKPRQMAVHNGYLYVSKFAGQVTKLDANTLDSISSVNVGHNLEGIAELNGMLYVCDSHDGVNPMTKYEDIYIVNPSSMQSEGTIKVVKNPVDLKAANGKLYCLSHGNYADIGYALQEVDVTKKVAKKITVATHMALANDLLYLTNSATDWSKYPQISTVNTFSSYNVKTGKLNETSFLGENMPSGFDALSIYGMFADPYNGNIHFCVSDYKNNGDLYRFDKNGMFLNKFDTGGINPRTIVFIQ